jgi:ABC-type uncharacterized transport system substrate-binding protein
VVHGADDEQIPLADAQAALRCLRIDGQDAARVHERGRRRATLPARLSHVQLVVNLKTAKALGLKIPESFLLRADEVIE